jgi:hypothetical protein
VIASINRTSTIEAGAVCAAAMTGPRLIRFRKYGRGTPSRHREDMMKFPRMVLALVGALAAGSAMAHSGGLDKYGCHTDHATGKYHCHSKQAQQPQQPSATPRNSEPMPLLVASIRYPISDLDVLLVVHHLLVALGYLSPSTAPSGTITMDVREAIVAFRKDYRLQGGENIDGTLLLQLSQSVAVKCLPCLQRVP